MSCVNPFVTSGTYMSHLQRVSSIRWDKSIPLFLHDAIYLEVSLFRWTSQNAFSCVQMILYAMLHATWLFCGKMHSDWFNRIEILQGRWHRGEKVGYCYPSGLKRLFISGTYTSYLQRVFSIRWDNSIPLFLHAAIYFEVSLFCWTSQNAFSRVQMILCAMLHAALHTVSFVHGCFAGKCILTGSTE